MSGRTSPSRRAASGSTWPPSARRSGMANSATDISPTLKEEATRSLESVVRLEDNTEQRRLAAVLAADVVGYSALLQRTEEATYAEFEQLRINGAQPLPPCRATYQDYG